MLKALFTLGGAAALLTGCTVAQNAGPPVVAGSNSGSAPVIDAVTQRTVYAYGFPTVVTEFHFHDVDGDVRFIARELQDTNGPATPRSVQGANISFPAEMQRRGAIFVGAWPCGANRYYVNMHAYLIDQAGNHSNTVAYSIHCNGG